MATFLFNPVSASRTLGVVGLVLLATENLECRQGVVQVCANYRGRVLGCECPGDVSGGLAVRATVVQERFGTVFPPGLDAGGILDLDPEGGRERSRCAIIGLARQGLKVLGATPRDLFYGVDFLQDVTDSAGVEVISANLVDAATRRLLFEPWVRVTTGDIALRVTSVCVLQAELHRPELGWAVVQPDSALDAMWRTAPEPTDVTVLLTNMAPDKAADLANMFKQIDLVITSSREPPRGEGNVRVIQPHGEGRALDILELRRVGESELQVMPNFIPLTAAAREDDQTRLWLENCIAGNHR